MSHPAQQTYDPLPLTSEDQTSTALYNAPLSPDPRTTSFGTPQMSHADLPYDPASATAAQPRFMGQYAEAGSRGSFSPSLNSVQPSPSDYGSIYALNDPNGSNRLTSYRDDPDAVPMSPVGHSRPLATKNEMYAAPRTKSRRKFIILGAILGLLLVAAAVIIPVYFTVIKPNSENSSAKTGASNGNAATRPSSPTSASEPAPSAAAVVSGGDGSIITMENGETFTYRNRFGGRWYYDVNDPFNNSARPQSWSPALNERFDYGPQRIRGVNLGGWLVTEPFISPAPYQRYIEAGTIVVDEMELTAAMRADRAGGGIDQLEEHYRTFITEKDFADIAGAGLNYIRVPIGFWAVETMPGEPFLEGVSWTYFVKAIKWARKYGLRINLDLHAAPGSQNGWNHSGRLGTIGFLHGPMGYANAQRTLDVIRVMAEFISQPQYRDVVTMFGILNEPLGDPIGMDALSRFYLEAYRIIREVGGIGEGNGPWISFHDGFLGRSEWVGVFPQADRISLDTHPYLAFNAQSNAPISTYATTPCTAWAPLVQGSMNAFGLTNAGEWSLATTDCGLYLNGVNLGERYEGTYAGDWPVVGSCTEWTDWQSYTPEFKAGLRQFALASMDALQDYFFWTWRIGPSLVSGVVETPAWSYSLGLQEGWMPEDPRDADGVCGLPPFVGPFPSYHTGGAGAGDMPAAVTAALAWPPAQIELGGAVADLPAYTQTGPIPTRTADPITAMPEETLTRTVDAGNGWNDPSDTTGYVAEIPGCQYLDPWVDPSTAPPPACGLARREAIPAPLITSAPA